MIRSISTGEDHGSNRHHEAAQSRRSSETHREVGSRAPALRGVGTPDPDRAIPRRVPALRRERPYPHPVDRASTRKRIHASSDSRSLESLAVHPLRTRGNEGGAGDVRAAARRDAGRHRALWGAREGGTRLPPVPERLRNFEATSDDAGRLPALPGRPRHGGASRPGRRIPDQRAPGRGIERAGGHGGTMSETAPTPNPASGTDRVAPPSGTITVTSAAIEWVKRIRTKENKDGESLRLGVKAGGCSG